MKIGPGTCTGRSTSTSSRIFTKFSKGKDAEGRTKPFSTKFKFISIKNSMSSLASPSFSYGKKVGSKILEYSWSLYYLGPS